MRYQLRIYTVKRGEMADWVKEWDAKIRPLRVQKGFQVLGAWSLDGSDRFVWILGYDGPEGWDAAEKRYYASPERVALDPDPARHLEKTEKWFMSPVSR
jgi:hypothetical protein